LYFLIQILLKCNYYLEPTGDVFRIKMHQRISLQLYGWPNTTLKRLC